MVRSADRRGRKHGGAARKPARWVNELRRSSRSRIVATSTRPAAGLTALRAAFADFERGLDPGRRTTGHWDALSREIAAFRTAVKKDPTFSPCDYRLGVRCRRSPRWRRPKVYASIMRPRVRPSYVAKANVPL